jgi:hypothetical protein
LYLSQDASPWGGLRYNLDLRALYKASDAQGECPLVNGQEQPGLRLWTIRLLDVYGGETIFKLLSSKHQLEVFNCPELVLFKISLYSTVLSYFSCKTITSEGLEAFRNTHFNMNVMLSTQPFSG